MDSSSRSVANEALLSVSAETKRGRRAKGCRIFGFRNSDTAKLISVAYGVADQALAVGAGFLVNVALARTQQKKNTDVRTIYSVFTFLSACTTRQSLSLVQFMDPEDIAIVYPSICG